MPGIVEPSSHGPEQEQKQQQQQGLSRSKLVQRLLAAGANLPAFLHDLVYTQAAVVAGTEAAAFILEQGGESNIGLKPIAHIRPDDSDAQTRSAAIQAFQELIRPCITQGKDGAIEVNPGSDNIEAQFCLVTLLRNEGEIVAASAVITRCRDVERAHQRLMSMQLVAGYFDLYTLRRTVEHSRQVAQSHQHVLQLAGAVGTSEGFQSAAMNLCNEMATRTGASRVSLGWLKGERIRVKALSHTEQFDKKQELIVQLEKVMEECFDQDEVVQFAPEGEGTPNVTRDAASLSRSQGGNTVLSLPLRAKGEVVGVLTLEFSPGTELAPQAATGLAVATEVLAPQLLDRFDNDRWLITKTGVSVKKTAQLAIGPKHMLAKTLIVLGIAATLFLFLYRPMYYVQADFQFEPIEKRSLAAPFEGILQEVYVAPNQKVAKGDPMFKLNTDELAKQLASAKAEASRYAVEAAAALDRDRNRGQQDMQAHQIARFKQEAAEAQAALLEQKIDRATVLAPFDGQVLQVAGTDLKRREGGPVRLGEDLVEIQHASSDLRVALRVRDRDIQNVFVEQKGYVRTKSLPSESHEVIVTSIVPQPQSVEGDNVYTVFARPAASSKQWWVGQEGEARLEAGEHSLAWIITHRLTEWIQLTTWGWPIIGG